MNKKRFNIIAHILFVIYIVMLLLYTFLFGGWHPRWNVSDYYLRMSNFIPFKTMGSYIFKLSTNHIDVDLAVRFFLGNFICLMPLAVYFKVIHQKKFSFVILLSCAVSVVMEAVQLLLRIGTADIDAVILRLLGTAAAYLICALICKPKVKG